MNFQNICIDCITNVLDEDLNWLLAELERIGAMPIHITRQYGDQKYTEITFNKCLLDEIIDEVGFRNSSLLEFFEKDCSYLYSKVPCDCCGELDDVVSLRFNNGDTAKLVQAVAPEISDEWIATFGLEGPDNV